MHFRFWMRAKYLMGGLAYKANVSGQLRLLSVHTRDILVVILHDVNHKPKWWENLGGSPPHGSGQVATTCGQGSNYI